MKDGKIKTCEDISRDQILELVGDNSDIYKLICKVGFSYMYLPNENTALISTGAVFQGINGYLITNSATVEENSELEVAGNMFDGDKIDILEKSEKYSGLYSWSAGL